MVPAVPAVPAATGTLYFSLCYPAGPKPREPLPAQVNICVHTDLLVPGSPQCHRAEKP